MSLNGCKWQEKSFSIPMTVGKTYSHCQGCGAEIKGTVYRFNGKSFCQICFSAKKIRKSISGIFNTSKDKLWEFTDYNTTGKPIEIRSKGQWQRHIKKLGMHDDCKQIRTKEEIREIFLKKSKFKPVDRQERTRQILEIIRERRRIKL